MYQQKHPVLPGEERKTHSLHLPPHQPRHPGQHDKHAPRDERHRRAHVELGRPQPRQRGHGPGRRRGQLGVVVDGERVARDAEDRHAHEQGEGGGGEAGAVDGGEGAELGGEVGVAGGGGRGGEGGVGGAFFGGVFHFGGWVWGEFGRFLVGTLLVEGEVWWRWWWWLSSVKAAAEYTSKIGKKGTPKDKQTQPETEI